MDDQIEESKSQIECTINPAATFILSLATCSSLGGGMII